MKKVNITLLSCILLLTNSCSMFEPKKKVEFIVKALGVERKAASRYLHQLEDIGILKCIKV